jgi:hypothetical protein
MHLVRKSREDCVGSPGNYREVTSPGMIHSELAVADFSNTNISVKRLSMKLRRLKYVKLVNYFTQVTTTGCGRGLAKSFRPVFCSGICRAGTDIFAA